MRPKEFQEQALEAFEQFLAELKEQQDKAGKRMEVLKEAGLEEEEPPDSFAKTWEVLGNRGILPWIKNEDDELVPPPYAKRQDSYDRPVAHVCMKLPTGGGKTLLGAMALERMRPKPGLVLWITPSRAIFRQTWRAFAHRLHPYRQALERACGGRVKLLKKTDSFSLADLENHLCVLPLMLQATDRQDRHFLKIFHDTGRYPAFFPEPDDKAARDKLLEKHPDLETTGGDNDEPAPANGSAIKHSLFNVLKIARPIIILDEAHNAYTAKRRLRLCEFNPRFVLELSATPEPGVSNILVDVQGNALKREQMIKLPLNIHNFVGTGWQYALSKAKEQLEKLEREARQLQNESGRYIRPIMLVRVERVGSEQRDGQHIHAEDVREYLMTQLQVPEDYIRRKTAEKDEIADEDLLSCYSSVRYILTKDALREGWDCPFAYVLALLDSTRSQRALTQMTGRVLRQPDAELTGRTALDESYIYCYDRDVGEAIKNVKIGLEQEGMSDLAEFVRSGADTGANGKGGRLFPVRRRKPFRDLEIFLPQVMHRASRGYRLLDYENDVLGGLDWSKVATAQLDLNYAAIQEIQESTAILDLPVNLPKFDYDADEEKLEVEKELTVEFFSRRIYDVLPNPYLATQVIERMFENLRSQGHSDEDIFDRRYDLSEILKRRLTELIECEAQTVFCRKLESRAIRFELIADEDGFELAQELQKLVEENQLQLFHQHSEPYPLPLQKPLYEKVYAKEFNGLEKNFALYLDGHSAVAWWHRFAARQDYGLQGWKRHRVYPDFVVCVERGKGNARRVLALETKGLQLAGNADTQYKKKLFETLETAEPRVVEYGTMTLPKGKRRKTPMSLRMLFQDSYPEEFERLTQN